MIDSNIQGGAGEKRRNYRNKWDNFVCTVIKRAFDPKKSYYGEHIGSIANIELWNGKEFETIGQKRTFFLDLRGQMREVLVDKFIDPVSTDDWDAIRSLWEDDFDKDGFRFVQWLIDLYLELLYKDPRNDVSSFDFPYSEMTLENFKRLKRNEKKDPDFKNLPFEWKWRLSTLADSAQVSTGNVANSSGD